MSEPNFTRAALKGVLSIVQNATPENQPTDGVLDALWRLLDRHEGADFETKLSAIREDVEMLRRGQAVLPATSEAGSKLRQKLKAGMR